MSCKFSEDGSKVVVLHRRVNTNIDPFAMSPYWCEAIIFNTDSHEDDNFFKWRMDMRFQLEHEWLVTSELMVFLDIYDDRLVALRLSDGAPVWKSKVIPDPGPDLGSTFNNKQYLLATTGSYLHILNLQMNSYSRKYISSNHSLFTGHFKYFV